MYKLFYKSPGENAVTGESTEYHNTVAEIEADNFEELGQIATEVIQEIGGDINSYGVDIISRGVEYKNAVSTETQNLKNYNSNNTQKW